MHAPIYLDPEEVAAILAQPDRSTFEGQRDHALLSFLYNTGARIQEALDLRPSAIRFDAPAFVRLYGKGRRSGSVHCGRRRSRCSKRCSNASRGPTTNRSSSIATARRSAHPACASSSPSTFEAAAKTAPSLASKKVTPHSFRHSTAVHLVAAGVDITVIRSWLGHVSLDTTNHYAQSNLETKRKALDRLEASTNAAKPPRWKRDASVMAWLDAL